MKAPERNGLLLVKAYRWQPSAWFRLRARLAPAFPTPSVFELRLALRVNVAPSTPAVDLEFPRIRTARVPVVELGTSCSEDLLWFGDVCVDEVRTETGETCPQVSMDLFSPLPQVRTDGHVYESRSRLETEQRVMPFDSPVDRDREGFRKSFRETRSASGTERRVMSIWERIQPLLEPPLSFDLEPIVYLPSRLYPFQVDGVRFLADRESALLGDDMGTGKTVQAIVAMRALLQKGAIRSALIVVPLSVLRNWDRELEKWAPSIQVTVVRGTKEQRQIQWEKPAHVWLTTYGTVRSDIDDANRHRRFDLVVLDEIQAVKNRAAQQTQAVRKLRRARAWGLSGTPIENRLEDLCSIFGFLKPGLLRPEGVTPEAAKRAITPYFLRRRKQDVLDDLPPKKAFDYWLAMEKRQRDAYDLAEREGRVWLKDLGETVTVQHVFHLLQRLKMLCNRDPQSQESAKLDFLKDKLAEAVAEGSKALVFSQYLEEGVQLIARECADYKPCVLTGKLSINQRERELSRFQEDRACQLLIATPKTGGVGLNLVAGNYVFHFDHWWNPATSRQAEDRVHRIGQTRDVFVYHLWTEDTVEERIYRILERKQRLYADVIDSLSNVEGTGLSEEELFELFDLKPPRRRAGVPDSAESADAILKQLLNLTDQQFEAFVAKVYESQGFGTRLTGRSRDAGVDVVASRGTPGGVEKLAIQCKRYAPQSKVGRPEAQSLLGVVSSDASYTKGVLVTTASFSSDCLDFAHGRGDLELVDGATLVRVVRQLNLSVP